jgi:hypothetical protein
MEITEIVLPQSVTSPQMIWEVLDEVIGVNIRTEAHRFWHETQADPNLSPGEITIRYAHIQALLDFADRMDAANALISAKLMEHFGWKFPTHPSEDPV